MGLTTQTFDVLTRIAIGNGSLVYRAVEKTSLRQVALKLLTKDDHLDHGFDIPALLEAAPQIRQITGSHVCQLLDAYEDEDGPLLVYEFANGISGNEFPHRRKLEAAQAVDVAAQLMSALRSGERQRTPHGDLKPSNVIFVDTPEGRPFVFVLDWGLAAFREDLTTDSMPYLAPERLAGGPVSHQADLFAAGALLFYFLTGKVLAMGTTEQELKEGWARTRPELLGELRPDLPPKLVQWVAWLLALDPQKRPGSAVDAATALGMLHPPPPMVPPEAIRPRPLSASQRAQAAGPPSGIFTASGSRIAAAPASGVARPASSGARSGSSVSAPGQPAGSSTRHVVSSAKKGPAAMLAISIGVAAAIAGTGLWWFNRETPRANPVAAANAPARDETPVATVKEPFESKSKLNAAKDSPSTKKDTAQSAKTTPKSTAPKTAAAKTAAVKPAEEKPAASKPRDSKPADAKPVEMKGAAKVMPVVSVAVKAPSPPPAERRSEALVVESFSYPDATELHGQKAGRGWGGAWEGLGARIRSGSLNYTDHPAGGGSLVIGPGSETVSLSRVAGSMARMLVEQKGAPHWYFAALISHSDRSATPGGEVRLYPIEPNDAPNSLYVTVADLGGALRVSMPGVQVPVIVTDADKPVLLVCRIEATEPKGGKWDLSASLLVNPSVSAPSFREAGTPMVATVKNAKMPHLTGLLIRKSPGTATTELDEIRYSRHWAEISFKPAKPAAAAVKAAAK